MRFNKLDLNLLVAMDILLRERSITRAAERLNMSPSAMSNSLSRLRFFFKDDLLTQIGRKMEITPLGEELQVSVRNVLNQIESTIIEPPEFDPTTTDRVFSMYISDYTQMVLAPHLLALASSQNSSARFRFLPQVNNPHKNLEQGEADLLIIPSEFISPDHPSEILYKEQFVCLVWKDSQLAQSELTIEQYAAAGHVLMQPAHKRTDFFEHELVQQYGIYRTPVATTFSFSVLPSLIVGTEYIATVHTRLSRIMTQNLPVEIRTLPFKISPMEQCVQWHNFRSRDPGLIWLRSMLACAAQKMDRAVQPLHS
jgi:LysR family transcriptional regulator, nod-box dependent transcriptional activator